MRSDKVLGHLFYAPCNLVYMQLIFVSFIQVEHLCVFRLLLTFHYETWCTAAPVLS